MKNKNEKPKKKHWSKNKMISNQTKWSLWVDSVTWSWIESWELNTHEHTEDNKNNNKKRISKWQATDCWDLP